MNSPYHQGQRITEGHVFRRIPNWRTHFDEDEGRPDITAFAPRLQDGDALSAHLETLVSEVQAIRFMDEDPGLRNFGLCRLDIGQIVKETDGLAWVEYRGTAQPVLGHAHVVIRDCRAVEIQLVLARIARVVRPPRDLKDRA